MKPSKFLILKCHLQTGRLRFPLMLRPYHIGRKDPCRGLETQGESRANQQLFAGLDWRRWEMLEETPHIS